jgi:hypothetical protein
MQNIFNFKQIFKFPVLLIATTLVTTNLTAMNGKPEPINNHIAIVSSAFVKFAGVLTGGTIAFTGAAVEYVGHSARFFGDGVIKVSNATSEKMEEYPKVTTGTVLLGAAVAAYYLYGKRS